MRFSPVLSLVVIYFCVAGVAGESCLTVLYANDYFHNGLSFVDGKLSLKMNDYLPQNVGVDIVFHEYVPNQLTCAPEGARRCAFVPLGTDSDLREQYFMGTLPAGSGYSSIHMHDGQYLIAKDDSHVQEIDPSMIAGLAGTTESPSFPPAVGDIYLIRIVDKNNAHFERIAKLMVVNVEPDNEVVIRYEVIHDAIGKGKCYCHATELSVEAPSQTTDLTSSQLPKWILACTIILFVLYAMQVCCCNPCFCCGCGVNTILTVVAAKVPHRRAALAEYRELDL